MKSRLQDLTWCQRGSGYQTVLVTCAPGDQLGLVEASKLDAFSCPSCRLIRAGAGGKSCT